MNQQINTIREALQAALSDYQPYILQCKEALTALAELEAAMREPVAWIEPDHGRYTPHDTMAAYRTPKAGWQPVYLAAPPAQQARVCGVCSSDDAFSGTCGGGRNNPKALCYQAPAQQAQHKCRACGTHEVSLEVTCHNSRCDAYAKADTVHEGWKAQQAQAEAVPRTHALVPKRMTRAMERVTEEEGWTWEDLLAAAEAITEAEYTEIQMAEPAPQQSEAVQACGHSMSLLLRSAESNESLYCEACDDKSGRHDAERRETELLDANRRLQEKIGSADALKLHAIEELCQLGYTVKDGELIPPDHLHKLVEAAGHPLAAPQQAEAVPWHHVWGCRANAFGECDKGCKPPQQAEAVPPTHVLVPVELLNRVLDSEEVNEMADASDELRAMLAAAKKEAGHE